jgi:serine/threonine protein kinase
MNRIKLEDLSIVAKIGEGATTTVHKAVENSTGKYYAIKMMPLNRNTSQKYREQLLAEVETQQSLNHPNIIRCHGSFEKNDTIYVVLELAPDGDLYSILSGRLTEDKIRTIFKEIVSAVKFIHEKGIVHRDIKPENILVNWEGNFKLGDFGWACRHTDCEAAGGHAGTLEYMSPECLNKQRHSFPTDIWSLGVLLYELFHNKEPFEGENAAQLAAAIHSPLSFSDRVGPDAKDLIRSCLKADPVERPTIQQIASHHFLNPYSREPSASDSLSPARKPSNRINRSSSQLTLLPEAQNSNTQKIQVQPANPSRTILSKSFFAQQTPTVPQQEGHLRQSSTQLQNVFSQPQNRVNTDLAPTNPRTYQQALTMPERTLIRPSAAPLQTSSSSLNLHHPQPNYLNSRITLARNPLHSASVRQLLPNHQEDIHTSASEKRSL